MPERRVIQVRLHAALRDALDIEALVVEVATDADPAAVFEAAVATHPGLAGWRGTIVFGTDERLLANDAPLPAGVTMIHALPPVSGG